VNNNIDEYAVFGYPINHSLSPYIHAAFAKQTGQSINYQAIEVKPENFTQAVKDFFNSGGKGINCTVPLKEMAFDEVDVLSERAKFSGAVNTIKLMENGDLFGDNTDGFGLLKDLTDNLELSLAGKRILVLGAGGAARGILGPLLNSAPSSLCLVNRTKAKAQTLKNIFEPMGEIKVSTFNNLAGSAFDLIINATSASLSANLPPLPSQILAEGGVCYDLAYSKEATAFMTWGLKEGAVTSVDGLGMLVEQAAQAFYVWRNVMPDTINVRRELAKN
jgi:shikimate dehydrogenase